MGRLTIAALSLLLFAGPGFAEDGPLVGKPLPALELSHSLQGEAWSPNDLEGTVVLLDVFQLG